MKVLDLRCDAGHGFEGWFASEADYLSQGERGLVECPLCASRAVHRLPSAPRLNLSGAREPKAEAPGARQAAEATPPLTAPVMPATPSNEALWLRAVRHVMAQTEDVGERFPAEARRIHYGEAEQRGIRGHATRDEAEALRDEGIEIVAMPLPDVAKGTLQ